MKKIKGYILDKQWAVSLAVAVGTLTALEDQLKVLPEGDAKNWIMGAVIAAGGFLTRLRVWSKSTVAIIAARPGAPG